MTSRQFGRSQNGKWNGGEPDEPEELPLREEDAVNARAWNVNNTGAKRQGHTSECNENEAPSYKPSRHRISDSS